MTHTADLSDTAPDHPEDPGRRRIRLQVGS